MADGFLGPAGALANIIGFGAPIAQTGANLYQNQQNVNQRNANDQAFIKMVGSLDPTQYGWAQNWLKQAGPGAIPDIQAALGGAKAIGEQFQQQALAPKIAEIFNSNLSPEEKFSRYAALVGDPTLYEKFLEAKERSSWAAAFKQPPMAMGDMQSALAMLAASYPNLPPPVKASIAMATGPNATYGEVKALYDKAFGPAYGSSLYGMHYLPVPGFDASGMPTVDFTPVGTRFPPGTPPPAATTPPPPGAPRPAPSPVPSAVPSAAPTATPDLGGGGAASLPPRAPNLPPLGSMPSPEPTVGLPPPTPEATATAEPGGITTPEGAPSPDILGTPTPAAGATPAIGAGAGEAVPGVSAGGEEPPPPGAPPTPMGGRPRVDPNTGVITGFKISQRESTAIGLSQNILPQLKDLQDHMNAVGIERYNRVMIDRGLGSIFAKHLDILPGTDPDEVVPNAQIDLYGDPAYRQLQAEDRQLAFLVSEQITVSAMAKAALLASANTRAYQFLQSSAGHIPEPTGDFNSVMTNIATLGWKGGPYQTTLRQYGVPVMMGAPTGGFPPTMRGPVPGAKPPPGPTGPPPPPPPGMNPKDYKPKWDSSRGQWYVE